MFRSKKRKLLQNLTNATETTNYPSWLQELVSETAKGMSVTYININFCHYIFFASYLPPFLGFSL